MTTNTRPSDSIDQSPAKPGAATQNDVTGHAPAETDNPLESIGKAIVDPVASAAEDEEPGPDGVPKVTPGG